jgi:hypothetical protein
MGRIGAVRQNLREEMVGRMLTFKESIRTLRSPAGLQTRRWRRIHQSSPKENASGESTSPDPDPSFSN